MVPKLAIPEEEPVEMCICKLATGVCDSTSDVAEMLHMKASNAIVLPDGALTIHNEADRPTISALKGVGLNLAVLLREVIHLLQDGVIEKMRAHEQHALHVISENGSTTSRWHFNEILPSSQKSR